MIMVRPPVDFPDDESSPTFLRAAMNAGHWWCIGPVPEDHQMGLPFKSQCPVCLKRHVEKHSQLVNAAGVPFNLAQESIPTLDLQPMSCAFTGPCGISAQLFYVGVCGICEDATWALGAFNQKAWTPEELANLGAQQEDGID